MPDAPVTLLPENSANSSPLAGIGWMALTGVMFVGVTAAVKHGAAELPAAVSAFLRYVLGLVFLVPLVRPLMRTRLTRRQLRLFGLRGLAHTMGVTLWFYAMTRITIAEVTSLNFMTPIYVTLGAALFLGERLAFRRIAAIAIAFVGALIILRPGFREVSDGHLAMLLAAVFLSFSYLSAKRLSGEVSAPLIVAMLSIVVTIGLVPLAVSVWQTPTLEELGWMFVVAFFATGGHYTMTRAFAAAPVSVTQPVTFTQLIWSVLIGMLLFGEPLDIWVIFGGCLIVGAATLIAIREAMLGARRNQQ